MQYQPKMPGHIWVSSVFLKSLFGKNGYEEAILKIKIKVEEKAFVRFYVIIPGLHVSVIYIVSLLFWQSLGLIHLLLFSILKVLI